MMGKCSDQDVSELEDCVEIGTVNFVEREIECGDAMVVGKKNRAQ